MGELPLILKGDTISNVGDTISAVEDIHDYGENTISSLGISPVVKK